MVASLSMINLGVSMPNFIVDAFIFPYGKTKNWQKRLSTDPLK